MPLCNAYPVTHLSPLAPSRLQKFFEHFQCHILTLLIKRKTRDGVDFYNKYAEVVEIRTQILPIHRHKLRKFITYVTY